ncbi:hypothetical protein Droror1_Dr00008525 [Drosera rotundifolia]
MGVVNYGLMFITNIVNHREKQHLIVVLNFRQYSRRGGATKFLMFTQILLLKLMLNEVEAQYSSSPSHSNGSLQFASLEDSFCISLEGPESNSSSNGLERS